LEHTRVRLARGEMTGVQPGSAAIVTAVVTNSLALVEQATGKGRSPARGDLTDKKGVFLDAAKTMAETVSFNRACAFKGALSTSAMPRQNRSGRGFSFQQLGRTAADGTVGINPGNHCTGTPGARVSPLCLGFPVLARVTYWPIHWQAEGFRQAPPAPAAAPFPKALRPAHRLQTKHPL
jgi:hypothetical protein